MSTYTKENPFLATVKERRLLTPAGDKKETYHIVLGLAGSGITHRAGDCVAILPANSNEAVDGALQTLGLPELEEVIDKRTQKVWSLRDFLKHRVNLCRLPVGPGTPQELANKMAALLPRYYSIASSMNVVGDEVHLTVKNRKQAGVCTPYLCNRAPIGEPAVPLYVQPTRHFLLPEDPSQSIIMVGPGTGIAPYRSFMQERMAQNATGDHWLFFGEWTRAGHYFYESDWQTWIDEGKLRVDAAFSRDQADKIYVQDKLWEQRADLYRWLEQGAIFYLCGDAKQMAPAVEQTLLNIFENQGHSDSKAFLKDLRKQGRYLKDVY